jgi:glyoxylase-like metal-dependent hydrolase (beta-lactamase superfamily II)
MEDRGRGGRVARAGLIVALLSLGAMAAQAQQDFSQVEIRSTPLAEGIAMLEGAGGNLGVCFGPDGTFLIDDQFAPLTDKIRAAIAELTKSGVEPASREPIRFLVNTHFHPDHTGGNENLGRAGTLIFAHDRVRARMRVERIIASRGVTTPPAAPEALPIVTFEDGVTFHLNGQTIEVHHVAPAHTDGDSIVRFREADILHLGDTFFSGIYPYIDVESGGSVDGMITAVDRALSMAGPSTRIIPGHGPLSGREELQRTRSMLVAVRDRVRELIGAGNDREAVLAARPSRAFDEAFGGGFMTPDRFVSTVYTSLVASDGG